MSNVRVQLLGPPQITVADRPIDALPAKALALLAYLALAEAPVPRERLIGLLWAESSPEAARKNMRNALWAIRKALGDTALRADADRLVLAEAIPVDVRTFELRVGALFAPPEEGAAPTIEYYQAAAAGYGGALLDGVFIPDAPEFEVWLTATRERLHQIYMRLVHAWAGAARQAGAWAAVVQAAQRALADDPLQEPLHQLLIEAFARRGERAEALRQYESLRLVLERELGVAPLPETEALRTAVLNGAFHHAPPDHGVSASIRPPRPPILGEPAPPPFIGRAAERAALDAFFAQSLAGRQAVVLLIGEVGIGKTRLWREWSAQLPADITVLETRCLSATRRLPLAPLIDLFAEPACLRELIRPDSPLDPIWLTELARLFPEVRTAANVPVPLALPPDEERRRMFEAFVQWLRAVNSRGMVIFLDDLQWADQATLDWCAYLLMRMRDRPLLLVASYRPEAAEPALTQQLADWRRADRLHEIALSRLNDQELAELVAALPAGAADPAQVQARSGGNPYFAIELQRAGPAKLPLALTDLVQARLSALPNHAQQVVQAAAVLDPDIDLPTLRRTSGRSEEETVDALDLLLQAALLRERSGIYQFTHTLIAEVTQAGLSSARRAFLHRRAAEARTALPPARVNGLAGRIAHHYAQAGDEVAAAQFADRAAGYALTLTAAAEAVEWRRQALSWAPTAERRYALAQALDRQGDLPAARAAYTAAHDALAQSGNPAQALRARLDLAYTFLSSGDGAQAIAVVEAALPALDGAADPEAAAFAHFLLGAGLQQTGADAAAAERELSAAAALAEQHHLPHLLARSTFQRGNLLAEAGALPAAVAAFHATIRLAHAAGDLFQEVLGYNNAAYHTLLLGEQRQAAELLEAGMALAERHALQVPLQWLYSTAGEAALATEQWEAAEAWFKRSLSEAQHQRNQLQVAGAYAGLGRAALGGGDRAGAREWLRSAEAQAAGQVAYRLRQQLDQLRVDASAVTQPHTHLP